MDAQLKAKWVEALRSGEYSQGRGCLKSDRGYCCLGVLAVVMGLEFEDHPIANSIVQNGQLAGYAPLAEAAGVSDLSPLWFRNDGMYDQAEHSFSEIADYIEENL